MTQTLPLWTRSELCEATHGSLSADVTVQSVCIDTRQLEPGALFIALQGDHSDGHRFIQNALSQGAACVMVHDRQAVIDAGLMDDPRLLFVDNTMKGLEALGHFARKRFNGKAIAITGSVGKTTTKTMLFQALQPYGKTHASVASYNNHWGVPLTLARLPRDADFCISEVGMNHPGEIAPLAEQIRPDIALITTIGTAHLGHMGSIEAIAREKATLFQALIPPDGHAIALEGTPCLSLVAAEVPHDCSFWTIGTSHAATVRIDALQCHGQGSHFHLHTPTGDTDVSLSAPGQHLAQNAALALGAVSALGLLPQAAASALVSYKPEAGRGLKCLLPGNVTLIDESYNASGPSMRAALATLALLPASRRIAALGDMRELGEFSDDEHRALTAPIMAASALTFCCGPHMKSLYDSLPQSLRGGYAPDATQLAPLVQAAVRSGDVLLVKGSLGSRMRDLIVLLNAHPSVQEASSSVSP
ncbi:MULTISPECIES: UDP-N-acetylmuramoyl-tripeptide--D-alanyl-D-alanine ligase [unclassified Saccharibacter]|uniref:UDP-N-acetylmuramoyl-tripeptide--D-alanyl-D- alanine ligase n=1 Tax=unclassified Saccharibacter TaxID=2648722 RepID=UPI00132900E9|nr:MULTISPECIES: UDP-N-acetylmuramoyl-tripeptide--D-alanyl-D-alanine ligase [unclassified Saccharibacter]MXV35490.1 UDP-N-acetylmuramoyl-tripeptide--D-alanyl-D-alanine ligase [Saccharibacter sp. EH611]MXV58150.1 UDP-N-acetylmuramoyl-tripeptide--D-alanyl-D-alanine ligase [Saccharibacter sp. EH70]MXV65424.1 UDP-N-acetylmuramoyl-tripeptide--D-alanyl-D-alanine ligase [Saccharibacter sp. EH60]